MVAGRLFASLGLEPGVVPLGDQVWADTKVEAGFLAPGTVLSNVLTGESLVIDGTPLRLAALFSRYPAAMLAYSAPG